jgi:CheY-like chemotaxis protein
LATLVVDDNAITRRVLQAHLERIGQEVLSASGGNDALALLETAPEIDLVVTDVQMPELDGFGFIERLRERPEWQALPVIVCSGTADRASVQRARDLGIRSFLVKPVVAANLQREVRSHLKDVLPRLAPAPEVEERLGVSRKQYNALASDFAQQIDGLLEVAQQAVDTGMGLPDDLAGQLKRFAESCSAVGAARALPLITRMSADGTVLASPDEGRALRRELTLLKQVLERRIGQTA